MPSFTTALPDLHGAGPIVNMAITVGGAAEAALRRAGSAVPSPVRVLAMIDTGATNTVIRRGLAQQLDLQPVGVTHINTPSSTNVPCYEYQVRLVFPNNVVGETIAIEAPLQGQSIQCLIGREVLAHGVFVYIGYSNLFSLSF